MKHYAWDPARNERLKRERGVSFEDVAFHIEAGAEATVTKDSRLHKFVEGQIVERPAGKSPQRQR